MASESTDARCGLSEYQPKTSTSSKATSMLPCVNVIDVRYSEAFVASLRMWNRPDQGTVVVNMDPFAPRIPLEILLGLGRGTSPGFGRTRELELESRNWLRAARIEHILIPYPDRLRLLDFESLRRIVDPSIRIWLLTFRQERKAVQTNVVVAGWRQSSVRMLNPLTAGWPAGGRPHIPATRAIEPLSWVIHRGIFEDLVLRGIEKVEIGQRSGLLEIGPKFLRRWIAIASADHSGVPCSFRLLGITLKLAALGRFGQVRRVGSEPLATEVRQSELWEGSGRNPAPGLRRLLVASGLSSLELSAIDVDQVLGNRGFVSLAGIRFSGQLALRVHSRKLDVAHSDQSTWLFPESDQIRPKGQGQVSISNLPLFLEGDAAGKRSRGIAISPKVSELEALIQIGRIERVGESLSLGRKFTLDQAIQDSVMKLVDDGVVEARESRFDLRPNMRQIVQRALRGTNDQDLDSVAPRVPSR